MVFCVYSLIRHFLMMSNSFFMSVKLGFKITRWPSARRGLILQFDLINWVTLWQVLTFVFLFLVFFSVQFHLHLKNSSWKLHL